jgi:hypothetical protein
MVDNVGKKCDVRGFSLLEIMFAFIIVALSILPMIGFITDKYREVPVIESYRFAQERGYDIMVRTMNEIPFEMLRASPSPGQPGSIIAQPSPTNSAWNSDFATTLLNSVFPGSTLLTTTTVVDRKNIHYLMTLEVLDIEDESPTEFSGTDWENPTTWNEFYFDFYRIPEFYKQPNWVSASSTDGIIPTGLVTPYQFHTVTETTGLKRWGPGERLASGSIHFKKGDVEWGYPRDQKDRTRPWYSKNENTTLAYCTMKKLRLAISWNLAIKNYASPAATDGRPLRSSFVAFKTDISPEWENR